jgi:hypothetical protein
LRFVILVVCFIAFCNLAISQNTDPAQGEKLLKMMSRKLADAKLFTFSTSEFHDRFKPSGQKVQLTVTRDVIVRRPDGFWTKYKGDRDFEFWYDGKMLTGISNEKKIYIQHEMPPTLDQAMDMLAQRLNIDLPMSDILYSSPYDAFIDDQTRGGFKDKEVIEGSSCNHLAYIGAAVDWELWINEKDSLPCKLEMKYKGEKGVSFYRITFSNWNLKPQLKQDAFASKIPEGYVRIPILERVVVDKKEGGSE